MAHMIERHDNGAVGFCDIHGGTWHGLSQYEELNGPVPHSKVHSVFNFDIEKQQLSRQKTTGEWEAQKAWSIVRKDLDLTLVPSVGAVFNVMSHKDMFTKVEKGLLYHYPDLEIESAGTLENGATAFVNLKVKDLKVHGDDSANVCRMMFYNPLGKGTYALGVHNVRIVCNNTLRASEAEANANASLRKIRHTASAGDRINEALVDLAEIRMGLDSLEKQLNTLAKDQMSTMQVQQFLETMFPVSRDMSKAGMTKAKQSRQELEFLYEEAEGLKKNTARTKYSMLQAVTYWLDHPSTLRKNQDSMSIRWDGIVGNRSVRKQKALTNLISV